MEILNKNITHCLKKKWVHFPFYSALPYEDAALSSTFNWLRRAEGSPLIKLFLVFSFSIFHFQFSISQIHPVNVTTVLTPPYSVYLADYAAPGCEQLRVILLQRDLTQSSYQLYLKMSIEWNGREIIRTTPAYRPSPIIVSPGVPTVISGSDLYHYLDPQNMDFTGYSRETYLRTKALPEGQYRITFTAYDYARPEVSLSLPGSTFIYLSKAEPPMLNMPPNQYIQPAYSVQNVQFSWLPRNISSPNSVNSTEYLLELFEIRPEGYHPNEIVKSTRPVFSTQTAQSYYIYTIADPTLTVGLQYAWRVRAIDLQGRDAIRNNGYSEVFSFTYGDNGHQGEAGVNAPATVGGFTVEPAAPRRANATWVLNSEADGYKIMYRRTGTPGEPPAWTEEETAKDKIELLGLTPGATYEARLQSKKGTRWGGYSDLIDFTMPPLLVIECGDPYNRPELHREPLPELRRMAEIDAGGFPVTVLEATGSNGRFSGRGYAQVPMLGYVKLRVEFNNIFVNSDYYLVEGQIRAITDWENNAIWNADALTEGGGKTGKVIDGTEQVDIIVDFEIPNAESISIENGKLRIEKEDGSVVFIDIEDATGITGNTDPSPSGGNGGGSSLTVKDAANNLYSVDTATGQATYLGKASPLGGDGGGLFDTKKIASDRGIAVFAPATGSKYAFDVYDKQYKASSLFTEKYQELKTQGSEAYAVPFKLVPVGATDVIYITFTPASEDAKYPEKKIDPEQIIFRTTAGAEFKINGEWKIENGKWTAEVILPSGKADDGYELYALHPVWVQNASGYQYDMLGKLTVVSYAVKTPKLKLVPVNGNMVDDAMVKQYLDKVYLPVAVNWQVSADSSFNYDIPKDKLDVTGSNMFSQYTQAMKDMNAAFIQNRGGSYDPEALYIFIVQYASEENTSGDMPRGKQFGYIFTEILKKINGKPNEIIGRTVAHELGHGIFRLKHTFDNEYRIQQETTDNLMDYSWGNSLVKHQWDAIHDPGMVIGMFEHDEDAMFSLFDIIWLGNYLFGLAKDTQESQIEKSLTLYNHIYEKYDHYKTESKAANINLTLDQYQVWSVRQSSHQGIAKKVFERLKNNETSFSLHNEGIYMEEYVLEGKTYQLVVYSKKESITLTQNIRIPSFFSLRKNKFVKAGFTKQYGLIVFYDDTGNVQMVIQIIGENSGTTTYQWLNYLGIILPSEEQKKEDKSILSRMISVPLWPIEKLILLWGSNSGLEELMSKSTLTVQEIAEVRKIIETIEDDEKRAEAYLELQMKAPYHNQRDNESPATEEDITNNSWMTTYNISTAGDIMCNLTSQAMCLEYLGVSSPCSNCSSECDSYSQFEDYLECIRVDNEFDHRGKPATRKKLAELFDNLSCNPVELNTYEKIDIEAKLKPSLKNGCSVLISAFGHIVKLKGITDEGLIVDDPYGKVVDFSQPGSTPKYKKDGKDYRNGKDFSEEEGKNNVWKWTELSTNKVKIVSAEIYCSK